MGKRYKYYNRSIFLGYLYLSKKKNKISFWAKINKEFEKWFNSKE